jgi:DNA replication protein DnaC
MDQIDFTRCSALNNVPTKKLQEALAAVDDGKYESSEKVVMKTALMRYFESNIPIGYWFLKMERDFVGDPRLKTKYEEYTADIKASYVNGGSLCLKGLHGTGKTMTVTCILKKAAQKGYSCLYTTLSDIVSVMTSGSGEDRFLSRRELNLVDFLVIDEFDSRFFTTENASDLYARSLEGVFRTRSQNNLPTLMCTNSPNVVESFHGPLKASIDSLMKGYTKEFAVGGKDIRKEGK